MSEQLPEVILFQEDEKALGYMYQLPPKNQLPRSIAVKSIDYDVEQFMEGNLQIIGPRPLAGTVYYLHPYKKNTYVHDSLDANYYLKEKVELFKRVGQLVGARSIKTTVEQSESQKVEIKVDADGSYKVIKGKVEVKTAEETKKTSSFEISDNYNIQANFDLDKNIDDLKNLIDDYSLYHEIDLISLIEARDSRTTGTKLSRRTIKSELSSEYNHLLEISFAIASPIFSASTNFTKNRQELNRLRIAIDFEF